MPEIMQLGPDDNDIGPYLTPCPADYPPCPLCGKHPDMLESGHIICCNMLVDSADAWFLLPRALTWTTDPPQVAGWYHWMSGKGQNITMIQTHIFNGVCGYWDGNGVFITDLNRGEWAGPIPAPID